jgi:tRNA nucleotidyltransferase (CCA-adding enzyme)
MGKHSEDIDIALDDIKGEELARLINDEIYPGQQKFGIVKENSDKSKHLETATMKIEGKFVDFVNLRSEKYTEESRIPAIDIGTPQEDASRRDITINSMFYNIQTQKVEDWLGNGIQDLKNGYVRTPLDPKITFEDDPLRILRVVRFAVRYQFEIDPQIEESVKCDDIKVYLII